MTELQRTSLGTIPVFYADAPPPFAAALVVRVGRADEHATRCGITHLVEHLSLPITGRRALMFNGSVDNIVTVFWATGDADLVLPFLTATADRLGALPLERLETEKNILMAEEATQGANIVRLAFALRFGPHHHGLIGYEEYGLLSLEAESVAEWAESRFTAGNAAVWLTGPPDELALGLPSGASRPAPEPRQLEEVEWPAFYSEGPFGAVAFSLLARRSSAFSAAISTLDHRVEQRIRYDLGLSYSPTAHFMPLTDELVHVVVVIDTMAGNTELVIEETLAVLDALAEDGPNAEELDDERRLAQRSLGDPADIPGSLSYAAIQHLLGAEFQQPATLVQARVELDAAEVAEALRDALDSLFVIAPPGTERPERLSPYPLSSSRSVSGRLYRESRLARRSNLPQLVLGEEGLTLQLEEHRCVTALFDSCALAMRYPDGSRMLLTGDGFFLQIEPGEWHNGREIIRAIDAAVPDERTVRVDAPATRRFDAIEEHAGALGHWRWAVSDELELLPERLEEDELPLAMLATSLGWRFGLLLATDRRLIFFAKIWKETWLEWPYEAVTEVRIRTRFREPRLSISIGDETFTFTESKREDYRRFVDALEPLLAER